MGKHTVEKIGGTTMSRFKDALDNILVGQRKEEDLYNRIIVVSAYGGITDKLLEHKKTNKSGVYALFASTDSSWTWGDAISNVGDSMCKINAQLEPLGLDLLFADRFVKERIEGVRSCLLDLTRLCSYGHFQLEEHLMTVREMLSAIGEAHSAYNTYSILKSMGINARFIDLTGWLETENYSFDEKIIHHFANIDYSKELPIVTGYTQCREGIMDSYDRGYSEITFSKIAVLTKACEGVIHKEFHLSSGDPKIIGEDKVVTIGQTNYDVADQLSDLGMEAIHPKAAKGMRQSGIPLRVRNAFEPDHPGTIIKEEYKSDYARVEIITGRKGVMAIECRDQDMMGRYDHDVRLMKHFVQNKIRYIAKDTNANTITHYVAEPLDMIKRITSSIQKEFTSAEIMVKKVALVSVIGNNMSFPKILSKAVSTLEENDIPVLTVHKCLRNVNIQFVIEENFFDTAICLLHEALIEKPIINEHE
ncbi:MAG: aspartate kinase [Proteobacteria bacterium]|nr:aspartate kinase [Pseudomonadota bacterium]